MDRHGIWAFRRDEGLDLVGAARIVEASSSCQRARERRVSIPGAAVRLHLEGDESPRR
jgi:hypothetical protein